MNIIIWLCVVLGLPGHVFAQCPELLEATQMPARGTFKNPKSWSDISVKGDLHRSGNSAFYESRFDGKASSLGYFFPADNVDNEHWFYRGVHQGTYTEPRGWRDYAFVGSIHLSKAGPYYESLFQGPGGSVYFPPGGQDNSSWIYRGLQAGTYTAPKDWNETSYVGAIHRTGKGPVYASKVNGVNRAHFPPAGTHNAAWNFKGLYAGTYRDPQNMGDIVRVGAIFGRDAGARYTAKFTGASDPLLTPYPSESQGENQWWRIQSNQCSALDSTATALQTGRVILPAAPAGHVTSRSLDMAGLIKGQRSAMNTGLLGGVRMPALKLVAQEERYEVRSANLLEASKGHIVGEIIVVTRDDGAFTSMINAPDHKGMLQGDANGVQTWRGAGENHVMDAHGKGAQAWVANEQDDFMRDGSVIQEQVAQVLASDNVSVDCSGKPVIDILAGFSESSARYVGDAYAFGLVQVETANLGLRNSQVAVRLRLVGVQIISKDYGVNTATLAQMGSLFESGITQYGADMVAAYFYPAAGSTAQGWAHTPGRFNINKATAPTAFRHEIGHNAGGSHCNSTGIDNFRFGYADLSSRPTRKTFMCGNNISFYSTPLVLDEQGKPRGDAKTADMARQWRERASDMSSYMKAINPPRGTLP